MDKSSLSLRSFTDSDTEKVADWLRKPHVARWFYPAEEWLYEINNRNKEFSFIKYFICEYGGKAIGFCQYYEYVKGGEDWYRKDADGAYSIDYFIGEEDFLKKGLGAETVRLLLEEIKKADGARTVVAKPERGNIVSENTL